MSTDWWKLGKNLCFYNSVETWDISRRVSWIQREVKKAKYIFKGTKQILEEYLINVIKINALTFFVFKMLFNKGNS